IQDATHCGAIHWAPDVHVLPSGIYETPDFLDQSRLRCFLLNLQLVCEHYSSTLVLLPKNWGALSPVLIHKASAIHLVPPPDGQSNCISQLREFNAPEVPLLWGGDSLNKMERQQLSPRQIFQQGSPFPDPQETAETLLEARRVRILQKNPPEEWIHILHRTWWIAALLLVIAIFSIPIRLDSPIVLTHDLAGEKQQYAGAPYLQYRFDGQDTMLRSAKNAIGRFTALVPTSGEVQEYILETIAKNHADTSSWLHNEGQTWIPSKEVSLRFYPPDHIFNPQIETMLPIWRYFTSLLTDTLAYVTEYYNPTGKGGRLHLGVDIAGKMGSRILAPFQGRAYTTIDDRGGVMIALSNGKTVLLFMHCDQLLYMDGQEVFAGDPIATVGITGHTTGPHVHFAVGKIMKNGPLHAGPINYKSTNPSEWVANSALSLRAK
ncbi:MAG TPA: M23 family metallopeptidase, partial [Fibrobacteraceae bacterium]|nr:M23 family metallopeptidase [Fibrobacteraceae bacterium]